MSIYKKSNKFNNMVDKTNNSDEETTKFSKENNDQVFEMNNLTIDDQSNSNGGGQNLEDELQVSKETNGKINTKVVVPQIDIVDSSIESFSNEVFMFSDVSCIFLFTLTVKEMCFFPTHFKGIECIFLIV